MRASHLSEQFESLRVQASAARFGMWIFLASELLLFGALFALYGSYRSMYPHDFGEALRHNNIALGTLNTLVLITSSLTVALSVHAMRHARHRASAGYIAATLALAMVFLAVKAFEYAAHFHEGIFPGAAFRFVGLDTFGSRMFFTLYFLFTGLHGLHVVAGMAVLTWLLVRVMRGSVTPSSHIALELGGLYWHLVDLVWIFLWPLLYLAR